MRGFSRWIRRNASTILTLIGGAGMIATVIFAVNEKENADEQLQQAQEEQPEELTVVQKAAVLVPAYAKTIATGVGSLMCVFSANALNVRQQALLVSSYAYLNKLYTDYKSRVCKLLPEKEAEFIDNSVEAERKDEDDGCPPWEGEQTFYLEKYGPFFERTMDEVIKAEYELNRLFILRGYATYNDFLHLLHLPDIPDGDKLGWEVGVGEEIYGYQWIDFDHRRFASGDILVCSIDMPFEAHEIFA